MKKLTLMMNDIVDEWIALKDLLVHVLELGIKAFLPGPASPRQQIRLVELIKLVRYLISLRGDLSLLHFNFYLT